MSDADVDMIREVNDAVANSDIEAMSARLDPDVVWEHNIGVGSPEEGVYRGRENVVALLERILEPWEYLRLELRELDDLGDARYVAKGEMHAKHVTSEVEIVVPYEQRLELRDGLLARGEMTTGSLG